jgi:filamentous hemagglutinin family protein
MAAYHPHPKPFRVSVGLPLLVTLVSTMSAPRPALAQLPLTADDTLGAENSQVIPFGGNTFAIEGGAARGSNLFHSFEEFNVNDGGFVYFANPAGIENILSRVTGNNPSGILGTLGVLGDANLFLLNPNGIVFGPNADLDLRGSFLATTAESFVFPDGSSFAAVNPQGAELLSINVPVGLQFGITPGQIASQDALLLVDSDRNLALVGGEILLDNTALASSSPGGSNIVLGSVGGAGTVELRVEGSTLGLNIPVETLRADIVLRNGTFVFGDTITSGGSIAIYSRNLDILDGSSVSLGILPGGGSELSQTGDVLIDATDTITVAGELSGISNSLSADSQGSVGNIRIRTESLFILDGALTALYNAGTGSTGSIQIEARDRVTLAGGSVLGNLVFPDAVGNIGDLEITTGILEVRDGSQIGNTTFGDGSAGAIRIEADRVLFSGDGTNVSTTLLSGVEAGAVGNGGDIEVTTRILEIDDTQFIASTSGNGNASNIRIEATERISLVGATALVDSRVNEQAIGNGGNIELVTGTLELLDGAGLNAATLGAGDAGTIRIEASDQIRLTGDSFISSGVGAEGVGFGGDINITTGVMDISDAAEIIAGTFGEGDAGTIQINASDRIVLSATSSIGSSVEADALGTGGDINIVTGTLEVLDQALLATDTLGNGDAGRIQIQARDRVTLSGGDISSTVEQSAVGNSGGISIATAVLEVLDGARLEAATSGNGNAGPIRIEASDRVTFSGTSADGSTLSSASSSVRPDAVGNSGGIEVTTRVLEALDQGGLITSTFGVGDAGNIQVTATERIRFSNGNAFSTVAAGALGNASDITINTRVLEAVDGSNLSTDTFGSGDAGNLQINASDRVTLISSSVSSGVSEGAIGAGGTIDINTSVLEVLDTSLLDTGTSGIGDGGAIRINASDRVVIAGLLSGAVSLVGATGVGNGGDIEIDTGVLELVNFGYLFNTNAGSGDAGDIRIRARDRVTFAGFSAAGSGLSGLFGAGIGNSGDIEITTRSLEVLDGSLLSTNTSGTGDAGTIRITASDRVVFAGTGTLPLPEFLDQQSPNNESPSIASSEVSIGATGRGGNLIITTGDLAILNGGRLSASTLGEGDAGNIEIQANRVLLAGTNDNGQLRSAVTTQVEAGATGNGGSIRISGDVLELFGGAGVSAATSGNGNAGNITLQIQDRVRLAGIGNNGETSGIFSTSTDAATGRGGEVDIRSAQVQLWDAATINAGTETGQPGGNITITAERFEARDGAQITTSTTGAGTAGTIRLNVRDQILLEGTDPTLARRLDRFGGDVVGNQIIDGTASSGLFAISDRNATGDGGNIFIDPEVMILRNGARIAVDSRGAGDGGDIRLQAGTLFLEDSFISATSRGTGTGGDIFITTDQFTLDNQARLTTETRSTDGGNITLTVAGTLVLRNNSRISTEAGTAGSGGNGGDLVINNANGFIIAVPDENSDLIANAFEGSGGNIDITTQAIYGLEFRPELTPQSDITASSQFGVDGTVVINTPAVDPTQGLVNLPTGVVDASNQIGQTCPTGVTASDQLGRFVITGRGGIAPNPQGVLESDRVEAAWVEGESGGLSGSSELSGVGELSEEADSVQRITEAQGWVMGADGQVHLVATADQDAAMPPPETMVCP